MEKCSNCNNDRFIVNRKRMLCQECNHLRLHGETIHETQSRKQQEYFERQKEKNKTKPIPIPKIYSIKQSTKKQNQRTEELSLVKKQVREEALDNNMYFCQGCGETGPLDCSHILSVKQRKDLELEKENINLFCRKCHVFWESWDIEKMVVLLTFEKDILYIKEKDEEAFYKIYYKLKDYILIGSYTNKEIFEKASLILSKI